MLSVPMLGTEYVGGAVTMQAALVQVGAGRSLGRGGARYVWATSVRQVFGLATVCKTHRECHYEPCTSASTKTQGGCLRSRGSPDGERAVLPRARWTTSWKCWSAH